MNIEKELLQGNHLPKESDAVLMEIRESLRKLHKTHPNQSDKIRDLELLLPIVFRISGTPNQQGSVVRILNTLKDKKITTARLEDQLKRIGRIT